jgi:hypothetical protein
LAYISGLNSYERFYLFLLVFCETALFVFLHRLQNKNCLSTRRFNPLSQNLSDAQLVKYYIGKFTYCLILFVSSFSHYSALNPGCAKFISARVARFFILHDTKMGKNVPNEHKTYQMFIKYPKSLENITNGHKIYKKFQSKGLQNLPKLGFLV